MEPARLTSRASAALAGRAVALLVSALAASPASAQVREGCAAQGLAIGAGLLRSEWSEFDERGRQLLRERGTLRESTLSAAGGCGRWALRAQLGRASGSRSYGGVSTAGEPIATSSRLQIDTLRLEATCCLATGWQAGGRLGTRRMTRDIASAGSARGYPEQFRTTRVEVGVRWEPWPPVEHELILEAWAGAGPRGKVKVEFPHADPTTLDLGRTRSLALGAEIGSASLRARSRVGWQARLGWAGEETGAGPAKALTRNGLVIGGAAQPRIRSSDWHLGASLVIALR